MSILKKFSLKGFYIHIPFCRQLCSYCDFYSTMSLENKALMMDALLQEMELRRHYLTMAPGEPATLYFGGGTPSLIAPEAISRMADKIRKVFGINNFIEFTVEANPDDLTADYLKDLQTIGVNRLSIGIQSFNDQYLRWMNRRHTAAQAIASVNRAQEAGFQNITIDLIYGLPQLGNREWEATLGQALQLGVQHISAYHLTIEPRTVLGKQLEKGLLQEIAEEESERQFATLHNSLTAAGYEHYEVSNFALPGRQALHNSNYWQQLPYIGFGPSAHSYDGESRQWNLSNNRQYLDALQKGASFFERESLSTEMRYNEYVLTGLRTAKGVDVDLIRRLFGEEYAGYFLQEVQGLLSNGAVVADGKRYMIPPLLFLQSDFIIKQLMH